MYSDRQGRGISFALWRARYRDMFEDKQGRICYGVQPYFKVGYVRIRSEAEKAAALGQ